MGRSYWQGMITWIRDVMAAEGKISREDLNLLHVTDSPAEAVSHIVTAYTAQLAEAQTRAHRRQKRRAVGDPSVRGGSGGGATRAP
jgi:predicted Rossmann-fold nucleotide-binding protein